MDSIRVVLADDHTILRKGLGALLERHSQFKVVGEAETGNEAVRLATEQQPDVMVIDIGMPDLNGVLATKRILKDNPDVAILILTMYANEEYVSEVFRAGARGYLLKDSAPDELIDAIRTVHSGEKYLSPKLSTLVIDEYITTADQPTDPLETLTDREREILQLIGEGHTNKQIAEKLYVSVKTVETHRSNLSKKLDLHSKSELIQYAIKRGLVTL